MPKKQYSNGKWYYRSLVVLGATLGGLVIGVLWTQNSYRDQMQAVKQEIAKTEASLLKAMERIKNLRLECDAAERSATEWENKAVHHQQRAQAWQHSSQAETARADSLQQVSDKFEAKLQACGSSLEGCRQYRSADRKAFTKHLERSDSALYVARQRVLVLEDAGDHLNHFFSWLRPRKKASPAQLPKSLEDTPIRFTRQNATEADPVVLDGSLNFYQTRAKIQARSLELVVIAFGLWMLYIIVMMVRQQYKSWKRSL